MRKILLAVLLPALTLSSCATYKATLTNDQGQTVVCEASGKNGIITGHYLREGFNECIKAAEANGYKQAPTASK